MLPALQNNLFTLLISVSAHIVIFTLLFMSFDTTPKLVTVQNRPNIVNAVVVDAAKVEVELQKLRDAENRKKKKEQARINKLKRDAAAKKKRAKEQKRLLKLKKQQVALEKKRKAEKKQLVDLANKRKAEEKKQKKAETKRKAIEADRREKERKQQLVAQLEAEEQERFEILARGEINKFQALIRQKVTRNWLKPSGVRKGLACTVRVRTIPGGDVVGVTIIKSSGNTIFDRSVERAVRKASPLPLPRDPAISARMREIDFEFVPEA